MKKTSIARLSMVVPVLAAAVLSGCASYQLGSMLPAGVDTVYVPTFVNQTREPFIESDTTRAVIEQLQLDGSLQIAGSAEEADGVLTVTLTGYDLSPLAYNKVRKTATEEYRLTLSAKVVLTDAKTGKVIVENPLVQGESTFEISGDFTSSKAQALPAAAKDLGHDIVKSVVEYW